MLQIFSSITLPLEAPEQEAIEQVRKQLQLPPGTPASIYRRSIDARKTPRFVYSIVFDTELQRDELRPFPHYEFPPPVQTERQPLIAGFGPAGLFCAWLLARCGMKPIVLERGDPVETRTNAVQKFWNDGFLDLESNVQFGEGGAGTFSDGKLTTRIHDPRCRKILETFVEFGAPREILFLAKPHIGTDRLRKVIRNLREDILFHGGKIRFRTCLTGLNIQNGKLQAVFLNGLRTPADLLVLATGNGAVDTYQMLLGQPLQIETKPFSVGFRIEHRQEQIDRAIYGASAGHPALPPAEYNFSHVTDKNQGKAVYSFCMCPGGQVVNASSLPGRLITNGMSCFARDGQNANAALLASVYPSSPQEGLALQEAIERNAYQAGGRFFAPVSTARAFRNGETPTRLGGIRPTFLPGTTPYEIGALFPTRITARLQEGLALFEHRICAEPDAVLTGPETRTSAPLRIRRHPESLCAEGADGLYPCGEGAGYAGGIMSSAADGLRIAETILRKERERQ